MWINPAGTSTTVPSLSGSLEWSRSPSGIVETLPAHHASMKQSYVQWLTENVEHPYLQTIDSTNSRELYIEDGHNVPCISFYKNFIPESSIVTPVILGAFVVRIHYEFRGARLNAQSMAASLQG